MKILLVKNFPTELHRALKIIAARRRQTISSLVIELISKAPAFEEIDECECLGEKEYGMAHKKIRVCTGGHSNSWQQDEMQENSHD